MIFVMVVLLTTAFSVNAQLNFGVKAGLNASTITGIKDYMAEEIGDGTISSSYKPGVHIGAFAQYMFSQEVGIEGGLYYSMLGAKVESKASFENYYLKATGTASPSYIQLPVSFLYKFNVGQDLQLYPSAGIYLGYGIGGKFKAELDTNVPAGLIDDDEFEYEMDYFGDDAGTNRFDMGLALGFNLQYSKFIIGLGYDLGLTNIFKEVDDASYKNGNVRISLGYLF